MLTTSKFKFNSLLDKDLAEIKLYYNLTLFNKNKTIYKTLSFCSSYSLEEIFNYKKEKYPNKTATIQFEIEE